MDKHKVIEIARSAMADLKPMPTREKGYVFHHGLRTAKIAMSLADIEDHSPKVDRDILFAAAVFHDIGKGTDPHNETGADMAEDLLEGECLPGEISGITQIIREHNQRHRAMDCTMVARIHQDADILDHFGTQNIWLAFHWNAAHEETPHQSLEYFRGPESERWQTWARASLNFDASLKIFDEKIAFEGDFFDRFAKEIEGA